jgi:hypothetical protein
MIIGLLFVLWGVYVFGYGIYMTAKHSPGSDGMGWFLAFINIIGGIMFTVSGIMLFNVQTQPVAAFAGGAKKLMGL